jgi:hypothetical protein
MQILPVRMVEMRDALQNPQPATARWPADAPKVQTEVTGRLQDSLGWQATQSRVHVVPDSIANFATVTNAGSDGQSVKVRDKVLFEGGEGEVECRGPKNARTSAPWLGYNACAAWG